MTEAADVVLVEQRSGVAVVQLARDAVRRGIDLPLVAGLRLEDDLVAIAMGTEDAQEGPRAFAAKRPPRWRGE